MKSIMDTEEGVCYKCHRITGTEVHHIFFGTANRKLSDADGLTVNLCRECHNSYHGGPDAAQNRRELCQKAQQRWLDYYGPDLISQGRDPAEEFMKRYAKNYL